MSQMAKDFWPIGEARKGQMYWMYMTFSQRSGRTGAERPNVLDVHDLFATKRADKKDEPDGPFIF
ncbi:MAG: hypothetical protein ABSC19_05085 [Syntrophorhabdales bacterium]